LLHKIDEEVLEQKKRLIFVLKIAIFY